MARSVEDYRDMMLALLPQGDAWPREPNSEWGKLFHGFADECGRIDVRHDQLLLEMNPATCVELLPEWEEDFGLPGGCMIGVGQTFTQRRNALVAKYKLIGNQSKQFFIDVAAGLGYTITITEYSAANPGPYTHTPTGLPISGDDWNYVWRINAPEITVQSRLSGSPIGEPYSTVGNKLLECTLYDLAHDHRVLFFNYGG